MDKFSKGAPIVSTSRDAAGMCMSDEMGRGDRDRIYAGSKGWSVMVLWDDGSEYVVPVPALKREAITNDEDLKDLGHLANCHRPLGMSNERAEELTGIDIDCITTIYDVQEAAEAKIEALAMKFAKAELVRDLSEDESKLQVSVLSILCGA